MLTSPFLGFMIAFALMLVALSGSSGRSKRKPMARRFRRLQVFSAAFMAFAHGSNDAQKTMGIITLALFSRRGHPDRRRSRSGSSSSRRPRCRSGPPSVAGGSCGRWASASSSWSRSTGSPPRRPPPRSCSRTAHFGMPVSTTQVISSAIMGVGASQGARAVRWGVARRILVAWILTIPAAGILAALAWVVLNLSGSADDRHPTPAAEGPR